MKLSSMLGIPATPQHPLLPPGSMYPRGGIPHGLPGAYGGHPGGLWPPGYPQQQMPVRPPPPPVPKPDPVQKYCQFPLPGNLRFKGAYWISSNSSFIQYCDGNIELFSIAPPLVIDLPTLR